MKRLSLLLVAFALIGSISAKSVDVETAKNIGSRFMISTNRAETASMSLTYVGRTASGIEAFYVFNCQPKGFVIVRSPASPGRCRWCRSGS